MNDAKESLMLNIACIVLAVLITAIGPITIFHWGISVDTLFLATACLTIAGVLLLSPAMAVLDGSFKLMLNQPEAKKPNVSTETVATEK